MGAFFYRLNRHYMGDVSLSRWIQILLLIPAALAVIGRPRGYWLVAGGMLVLFVLFTALSTLWRQRHYIQFTVGAMPDIAPQALQPADKLPIYASGLFGVEGKYADFTWLQGYFRTFATREHALICLVQPSRFALLGSWPEKEVGMWYIFFKDDEMREMRWGEVQFAGQKLPCLAVDHSIFIPKRGRFDRDKTLERTVYIACADEADLRRIVADLRYRRPVAANGQVIKQNGAGKFPHNNTEWKRIDG